MGGKLKGRSRGGELRTTLVGFAVVAVLVGIVTALAVALAGAVGVEFADLSRDPVAVFNGPNYAGVYANLTVLVWQVPATAALLAAAVLRHLGRRSDALMFLIAGLITALMAIDDFFLLHETLNETIGLSQKAEPIGYALAILAFTWFYRHRLRWDILPIAVALGAWGISAQLDAFGLEESFLIEDGAKLLGVGLWTFVVMRLVLAALRGLRSEEIAELDDGDDAIEIPSPAPQLPPRAPTALPAVPGGDNTATTPVPVVPPQRLRVEQETVARPAVVSVPVESRTEVYAAVRPRHRQPDQGPGGRTGPRHSTDPAQARHAPVNGRAIVNGHVPNLQAGPPTNGQHSGGHRAGGQHSREERDDHRRPNGPRSQRGHRYRDPE